MRTPIRSTVYLILLALLVLGVAGSAMATQWWSYMPQMTLTVTAPVSPYDTPIGSTVHVTGNAPDYDTLYDNGIIIGGQNTLVTLWTEWGSWTTYNAFDIQRTYGAPLNETLHLRTSDPAVPADDPTDPTASVNIHWISITDTGWSGTPQLYDLYVDVLPDSSHMHAMYVHWAYSANGGAYTSLTPYSVSGARVTIRISTGYEPGTLHVNNNTSYTFRADAMNAPATYKYVYVIVENAAIQTPTH